MAFTRNHAQQLNYVRLLQEADPNLRSFSTAASSLRTSALWTLLGVCKSTAQPATAESTCYSTALHWHRAPVVSFDRLTVHSRVIVARKDRLRGGHATDPRFKMLAPRYGRPVLWSCLAQASSWPSGLVPAIHAGKPTCAETFVSESELASLIKIMIYFRLSLPPCPDDDNMLYAGDAP